MSTVVYDAECPECGKNPMDIEPMQRAKVLAMAHGILSEHTNPGGKDLYFPHGKKIHLPNCCTWCDYEILKEELSK